MDKSNWGSQNDWSYSIIQTSDSGYAAVGYTSSFGAGGYDVYVVKLKPDGTIGWTKTIGGSSDEEGYSIIQTSDGGYAISGKTKSFSVGSWDVYVIKLDSTGTVQWTRTIGGIDTDVGTSIIQTSDSGYVVAGYTCSFGVGGCDVYVIKLFSTGTIQWIKTIGGSNDDIGYSIIQTSDGGYAIAGYTMSFGVDYYDVYVIKLSSDETIEWTKTIGGFHGDDASSIIQTSDGGYAIVGKTWSFGTSGADIYVIKLNSTGTVQWTKTIKGSQDDIGSSITQTSYSEYAIAGWTYSFGASEVDIFVIKLDTNFNTCSACSIQIVNSDTSSPNSQVSSPAPLTNNVNSSVSSGGNVSTGGTLTLICSSDIIENNFDKLTSLCYSNGKIKINFGRVYENISIGIKDVSGREIMRKELKNVDRTELDIKGNNGVYFIELKNKDRRVVFKVIKAR